MHNITINNDEHGCAIFTNACSMVYNSQTQLFAPSTTVTRRKHAYHVDGIVGAITLVAGTYLIVVTESLFVTNILEHQIYKVTDVDFILVQQNASRRHDSNYLEMLKTILVKEEAFYFSPTTNICLNLQDNFSKNSRPHAAKKFFWNHHLSTKLISMGLQSFVLPMIRGLVQCYNDCYINNQNDRFTFGMITRTSCKRAGTRYNCRGIDEHGHAANFVETEQFIIYQGQLSSFVQVRGSVPILWSQTPDGWKDYTPQIKLESQYALGHANVFEKHVSDLKKSYPGDLICLDLCNAMNEQKLTVMYRRLSEDANIKYIHFDLHLLCQGLNFERLEERLDKIPEFNSIGYFKYKFGEQELLSFDQEPVLKKQQGVFRTNCLDCCDRTNLTQSYIAKKVLLAQLFDLGIIGTKTISLLAYPKLERVFNHFWTSNGDIVSKLYTGTGALMADYTRTGQRSVTGLLNDGLNSVTRYMKNNFGDEHSSTQQCFDLFLGHMHAEHEELII